MFWWALGLGVKSCWTFVYTVESLANVRHPEESILFVGQKRVCAHTCKDITVSNCSMT